MYTDSVDHATKEAIDNVIDEYQAEACTYLGIALDTKLNLILIADNGRGIPVDVHETEQISKFAVVFTKLHSSGKYKNREINNYSTTIGLNGVGVKITSATSELFEAWTTKKNKTYKVVVERGVLKQAGTQAGIMKEKFPPLPFQQKVITTLLRYNPDPTVYGEKYCRISSSYLKELCSNLQHLCPSLFIELLIDGERFSYVSSKGIIGLLEPKGSDIDCKKFQVHCAALDLVLWWNSQEDGETVLSYVNCQKTKDGGTHVNALRSAITDAFGEAGKAVSSYLKEGLRCAFHLRIAEPQFQGQNKHRLLNPEASDLLNKHVTRNLELFLTENSKLKDSILQRAVALKKAHESYKKDRDAIKNLTKNKSKSLSLPDKLISATGCMPEQKELFLCLHGDTRVRLADGTTPTLREMAENPSKDYYGFTYDSSNDWVGVTRLLHPRQTQENAELLTITLDNGTSFTCTPDHLILRRDNLMVRADNLSVGDALKRYSPSDSIPIFYKVVKIEKVDSAPVYCLTVPNTENFLLANGIFVHNCEGASAAGPIIKARTRPLYQEVYMLKGKITNACRSEMGKILANPDIIGIIQSIGCGILDECDPKKSRVGKVFLITDADSDGRHIDALLVAFFINYMTPMVEAGKIYRVKSPLYVASYKDMHWYGKGMSDAEALADLMLKIPDKLKSKVSKKDGINITRFKGHGAASAEDIQEYALGPRRDVEVIRLPTGDADIVAGLMGDDVQARKELLAIDW
jgi:DNA gyrase/topoisomerase IV subunit B